MSDQQMPPTQRPPFEYQKWILEMNRQDAQRVHDKLDEFHKQVNEASVKGGELALRMALIINGGAAVSLLTFAGSLPKDQRHDIANTLVWFASGVALAALAVALAHFANYFMSCIASSKRRTWEYPFAEPGPMTRCYTIINGFFHVLTVFVGAASLGVFVYGIFEVRDALTHLK